MQNPFNVIFKEHSLGAADEAFIKDPLIDLHHLIARAAPGVGDGHSDGDALPGLDRPRRQLWRAQLEGGVAEPVAEGEEGRRGQVPVAHVVHA